MTRSLGTKDLRDAHKRVRQESAKQHLEFHKARAMLALPIQTTISDDEVKRLGLLWLYESMAEDDTLRLEGGGSEALWGSHADPTDRQWWSLRGSNHAQPSGPAQRHVTASVYEGP